MKSIRLAAEIRKVGGSSAARRIRRAGYVPAVIYGDGKPGVTIQIKRHDFEQTLRGHMSEHMLIDLVVGEEQPRKVLLKEVQNDPMTGKAVHVDFHEISMTKKLHVEVPIHLVGEPIGVSQQGGVLEHVLRTVEVSCLPTDIPEYLEVDVSGLTVGHSVTVADLKVDKSRITVITAPDLAVAAVLAPKTEEEVAPTAVEAAPAEPEVIREKKEGKEGEEAREGESSSAKEKKEVKEQKEKK